MALELSAGALARHGFVQTERALRFLADPALEGLTVAGVEALGDSADGDEALLGLLRIAESVREQQGEREAQTLLAQIGEPDTAGSRLAALLGSSVALGDFLGRHPEHLSALDGPLTALDAPAQLVRDHLLRAVGADPEAAVPVTSLGGRAARDALRVAYHEHLVQIAAADVTAADAPAVQPAVSAALSDLADASLEAALAVARGSVEGHERVRLAVMAMGKTGARELNYISDVDVIYVAAPAGGEGAAEEEIEDELIPVAAALCRELARVCADRTAEGSLWQVDANLRPEGKDGPLARTLDSCERYYRRWAASWEFQALLKARPAAGDRALGDAFVELVSPLVWQASAREGFVEDSRAMRRRVIDHIPRGEVERNVKLGPGGLRDVEFTVQLLQMVHGRSDETLRVAGTLPALARLRDGGYIGRESAAELEESYRFLRALEHRMQLHRLRRTQVLPTSAADLRRLARGLGCGPEDFIARYERTRRRVRHLHEEIYYRPLLVTASRLSDGQVRLSPESAQQRLAAIGYRDPVRALTHIEALTAGISRRAAIQRQLLPSLLEWFADGIDPDLGLLAFRRLSDTAGSAHWYMGMLRDSGAAARRLTRVLSSSRYVGEQLEQIPEAVRWLDRDEELRPLEREDLLGEFDAVIQRVSDAREATDVLRRTRRRELLRVAMAHLVGLIDAPEVARALTDIAEAVLRAGVRVAAYTVATAQSDDPVDSHSAAPRLGIELGVIAMGSFGAREMGYSSDADVQFVVADRGAGARTGELGNSVATTLQKILNAPSSGADMKVSADLRPEGRQGVLARPLESWRTYYQQSAQTWEKQALIRARPVVATDELAAELEAVMDRHRYPEQGLESRARRDVVTMKARVESERLPRGADPARHLKLGRGAMTDVEWVAQLLVLEHAGQHPELRHVTGTRDLLGVLAEEDLLGRRESEDLAEAWSLAWSLRRALFLWKGREASVLPVDRAELRAAAQLVLGEGGTATELEETYLRVTRHARAIAKEIIFGSADA